MGVSGKQANSHDDNLDLDSILDDLMSFDPSKAVVQAQQRQFNPVQNGHLAHQEVSPPPVSLQGQPHPPPTQPQPKADRSTSAVAHPGPFQLPESLNEDKGKNDHPVLTRRFSTVRPVNVLPAAASKDEGKTVLIKSGTSVLHSASDQVGIYGEGLSVQSL